MKKFVMNKNVDHNNKPYAKGVVVNEGEKDFKVLLANGHLDEVQGHQEDPKPEVLQEEKAAPAKTLPPQTVQKFEKKSKR